MKEFPYFVKINAVKRQSPDIHLAKATAIESRDRMQMAKSIFGVQKSKYVLENAYEAVRELIDSILFLEGYKSYSHEASVAYLSQLGFSESQINHVDRLRRKRNGIKYYGEDATSEEAENALKTAEETIKKLLEKKPALK